ncbi:hypothetical protein ACFLXY_11590 [Chloroflexota bacterium]
MKLRKTLSKNSVKGFHNNLPSPEEAEQYLDPEHFIYEGSIYYIAADSRVIRIGDVEVAIQKS